MVNWAFKTSQKIYLSQIKSLTKSNNLSFIKKKQKEIQGRISSVVKQIDGDLKVLSESKKILVKLLETADKVSVESRPEYVTDKKLSEIKKIVGKKAFEVGIGLETANDYVREHSINKGFSFNDYKKFSN